MLLYIWGFTNYYHQYPYISPKNGGMYSEKRLMYQSISNENL